MDKAKGVILALAAGIGAGAAGALPDPEMIAKLGPIAGAAVIWAELRLLPLVRELVGQTKAHRVELEAHGKELAAARGAKLAIVPDPVA